MTRVTYFLIALFVLTLSNDRLIFVPAADVTLVSEIAQTQARNADALQPLLFLEGTWHGQGNGPYGAYDFETIIERRGRWLLLTSNVFPPGTDRILFVSTQVYGYDDRGLVLQLFDTAGAFEFRGDAKDKAAHFEWKQGDKWKRVEMKLVGNNIHSRYDALEPAMFKEPVKFEGVWLPGKRPRPKS